MKNRNRFLLTTLLLGFILLTVSASANSGFSIEVFNSNTIIVDIDKVHEANILISLTDEDGIVLYKETINRHNVHNRKYQLKKLPFGTYTFIAEYDRVIKIQQIKKGSEILEIDESKLQTVFKPVFRHKFETLDLDMLFTSEYDISFQIRDSNRNTLYNEELTFVGPLQKRFKLVELEDGPFYFTIIIKDGSFEYEFKETFVVSSSIATN